MQVVSPERAIPLRLTCSGCAHWQRPGSSAAESEGTGRCGRFAEARPADARPRCNICWEPARSPAAHGIVLADS